MPISKYLPYNRPKMSYAELRWCPIADPLRAWALFDHDDCVAELVWSRDETAVRAEVRDQVWWLRFQTHGVTRAVLSWGDPEEPRLLFAGSLRRGLVQVLWGGAEFRFVSGRDADRGRWTGFDDVGGESALRIQRPVRGAGPCQAITCSTHPRNTAFIERLAVLWGALQLLRREQPWLVLVAPRLTEETAREALVSLRATVAS